MSETTEFVRYVAAPGARYNDKDAEVIGSELEAISSSGVNVTPAHIVATAQNPTSPLHKYFEWDDSRAATEYRKEQARELTNHLCVVVRRSGGVEETVKAQFSVKVRCTNEPTEDRCDPSPQYVSVRLVMDNPDYKEQVAEQAKRELLSWVRKYESIGITQFQAVYEAAKTL